MSTGGHAAMKPAVTSQQQLVQQDCSVLHPTPVACKTCQCAVPTSMLHRWCYHATAMHSLAAAVHLTMLSYSLVRQ